VKNSKIAPPGFALSETLDLGIWSSVVQISLNLLDVEELDLVVSEPDFDVLLIIFSIYWKIKAY
jgi:hypothetical protein